MSGTETPESADVLDRDGQWEIRVTVYRNGRKVGTCDTTGHETFDAAAYWASEGLRALIAEILDSLEATCDRPGMKADIPIKRAGLEAS